MSDTIGYAVIGLGVMGRTHVRAVHAARVAGLPCRLVAVCSPDARERAGLAGAGGNIGPTSHDEMMFDPSQVRGVAEPEMIARDGAVHAVSICTPTDTHAELAGIMLRAGKHVLIEKPVAIRSEDVRRLARVAADSGRVCMPAMCMRFWPGWDWLKARVVDGSFGRVKSAVFTRVGSRPGWSPAFYADAARCGGAIFDLHVHDADAVLWLFGRPREVVSVGSIDHITTQYRFAPSPGGPAIVSAEGGWYGADGFPFRMRYTVEFERAVADWDLSRADPLLLVRDERATPVKLPTETAYEREVRAFIALLAGGGGQSPVTLQDAIAVTELIEAERRSAQTGQPVTL
ncbi:MAG: Gfo/Idh/MocA family protein [Phycisphaerales bacterium]